MHIASGVFRFLASPAVVLPKPPESRFMALSFAPNLAPAAAELLPSFRLGVVALVGVVLSGDGERLPRLLRALPTALRCATTCRCCDPSTSESAPSALASSLVGKAEILRACTQKKQQFEFATRPNPCFQTCGGNFASNISLYKCPGFENIYSIVFLIFLAVNGFAPHTNLMVFEGLGFRYCDPRRQAMATMPPPSIPAVRGLPLSPRSSCC